MPIVPNANHLTRSFVLSFVSLNFCSRTRRYSISVTISLTVSSILRSSVSTGLSFSAAWIADQSRASAPMSMSSSTCRDGALFPYSVVGSFRQYSQARVSTHEEVRIWEGDIRRPDNVFSKQTSNAVSARLVNAILVSPATSFGRP